MNSSQKNAPAQTGASIGIFGILGIVFITLKLTEVITWSWVWVLAPFWMPLGIALSVFLIFFLATLAVSRD